jgi:hypothetical protein
MRAGLKPVILFAKPGWILRGGGRVANLDIDFVKNRAWNNGPAFISSLLTCTRSSSGDYYTKADGTLTTFAANTLRYGTNGLLVEEGRTNLCLQSQTLDNAAWTGNNITVTADQYTAPDGTATADKFAIDTANSEHRRYQAASFTFADATAYTFSAYVKLISGRWLGLRGGAPNTSYASFDLLNGVVGSKHASVTSSAIEALSGGWYRISVTWTTTSVGPDTCGLWFSDADGTEVGTFTGNGTDIVAAWGAQLEAGSFATSYIPTTTTSMARAVDVVTLATSGFGFNASAGTFYEEFLVPQVARSAAGFHVDNGTNTERYILYADNSARRVQFTVYDGNVDQCDMGNGGIAQITANTIVKGVGAYAADDFVTTYNGGAVDTDTSGTLPTVTTMRIGSFNGASDALCGYMRRVAYWNSRLANAALQTLTT